MKCEICETRDADQTITTHDFDFQVCSECVSGVELTVALIGTVVEFGVSPPAAISIVNEAMDEAIRKLCS